MARLAQLLVEEVLAWPNVSVHPHQFMAQELRVGKPEIGHVHAWAVVDIPFTLAIRNWLIENKLAQQHHWLPDSGWTSFRMLSSKDLQHALWLMRISYLRYALKSHLDAPAFLKDESGRLNLRPELAALLFNNRSSIPAF
jgi:hypothetical protein